MLIENVFHRCAVKISCTAEDFKGNDLSKIRQVNISRKGEDELIDHVIGTLLINDTSKLTFSVYDVYTKNGVDYTYFVVPVMVNGTHGAGAVGHAVCQYNNLFIGNTEEQYIGALNVEYNHTRKFNKSYVQTLYSLYPHAISNGDSSYEVGDISGLFLDFDETSCKFRIDNAGEYKRKLMSFLSGKGDKIIKTREGDAWKVQVDGEVNEVFNQSYGASIISFNWTQIGEIPLQGIALER